MNQNGPLSLLIVAAVLLPLMYFRLRRMRRVQPLKWQYLWVRPALILAVAILVLAEAPPARADLAWLALAGVLGAAAGWQFGRTTHIEMHPQKDMLMAKASPAGMLVLVVLVLVRVGLKSGLQLEADAWHVNMLLVTDASIVFSALLFSVRGLEMFLRARRVMGAKIAVLPPP